MRLFFILLLALSSQPSNAQNWRDEGPLLDEEFKSLVIIASQVLNDCKPPECQLVSVGRSAVAVAALIEEMTGSKVIQIPMSDLNANPNNPDLKLNDAKEKKLFQHLSSFYDVEKIKAKKIMTLDFTDSGQSLLSFTAYFKKWLIEEKSINTPISAIALKYTRNIEDIAADHASLIRAAKYYQVKVQNIIHLDEKIGPQFFFDRFHEFSPYGMYSFKYKIYQDEINDQKYLELKKDLRERLIQLQLQSPKPNQCGTLLNLVKKLTISNK